VDGFVMVLGEVTLTGVKNPDTPPPSGDGGQVVAVFIAVVAQSILGIVIALGSVPLLGFDLAFDDSPLRQVAIWVFNSEQKKGTTRKAGERVGGGEGGEGEGGHKDGRGADQQIAGNPDSLPAVTSNPSWKLEEV